MEVTTVFLTGAGGFAGHHALEHILVNTNWDVIATDSFRHKGTTDRISQVLEARDQPAGFPEYWHRRTSVITHDLTAPFTTRQEIYDIGAVDYMVCYASESHVDRSIDDPVPFVRNNVDVALNTLELARTLKPKAVIWISTDEVYGPVEADNLKGHAEWAPMLPSNPYSASKAAQEDIAISYWRTYGVPVIIVNCMNMIGERQDPEKFVPLALSKVLKDETVKIHGSPAEPGTRHYLHARNLADAVVFLLESTTPSRFREHAYTADAPVPNDALITDRPDRYNIAPPDRIDNFTLASRIAEIVGKPLKYKWEDFHAARPGHDAHYGLDSSKILNLGWSPPVPFDESLRRTVEWSLSNQSWLA